MRAPHAVEGLAEIAHLFDAFLVDQFGVLHDGHDAYPGAIDGLARLKATGAKVGLISNSGKRASPNIDRFTGLGFARSSFDAFTTSGEVAWGMLAKGGLAPPGARCLVLSRGADPHALAGLDATAAESGAECDLVLIAGSEGDRLSMDHYRRLLEPAAARGVPALCTNPDYVMLTPSGPRFGAGEIARAYEAMGGGVTYVGKPHAAIYDAALAALGRPDPARTLCIGDSLAHDVAGGAGAGLKTLLVSGGVPQEDGAEAVPDYACERFRWA